MKFPLSLATVLPACVLALSACSSVAPAGGAATTATATAQDVRQLGEIVDLRSGQRVSAEQLLAGLAAAPRVIIGEQHDQLSHHQIEQWLLQQLQGQRPQGSVLLEMLNPDQQAKVDKVKPWLQTDPVVRPEHVAELLAWQPNWKWEQYGDLVMTVMRAPYPVWSANLDRSEIKQLFIDQHGRRLPCAQGPGRAAARAGLDGRPRAAGARPGAAGRRRAGTAGGFRVVHAGRGARRRQRQVMRLTSLRCP